MDGWWGRRLEVAKTTMNILFRVASYESKKHRLYLHTGLDGLRDVSLRVTKHC